MPAEAQCASEVVLTENRQRGPVVAREEHHRVVSQLQFVEQVQDAAAEGDRSENAEYIYGKKQLRQIDSRVRVLLSSGYSASDLASHFEAEGALDVRALAALPELEPGEYYWNQLEGLQVDGLGVGASVNDLARVLGCANTRAGDQLTYSGETESVRFTIREGRFAAVEIFHYHE